MNWFLLGVAAVIAISLFAVVPRLNRWFAQRNGPPDPLNEADVYLAYGRSSQAIEILEQALRDQPDRTDIAKKLNTLKAKR